MIKIEQIPHLEQRYPTCGDWFTDKDGNTVIRTSIEMGERSCFLVAIHELIELFLCQQVGISEKTVDEFDIAYEKSRRPGDESEPGDDPAAPYQRQHNIATGIERILCAEIGMTWAEHKGLVENLP